MARLRVKSGIEVSWGNESVKGAGPARLLLLTLVVAMSAIACSKWSSLPKKLDANVGLKRRLRPKHSNGRHGRGLFLCLAMV